MANQPTTEGRILIKCHAGTADEAQLNDSIRNTWRLAISDPKQRSEIASLLGVNENALDPNKAPFEAEVSGAGFHRWRGLACNG